MEKLPSRATAQLQMGMGEQAKTSNLNRHTRHHKNRTRRSAAKQHNRGDNQQPSPQLVKKEKSQQPHSESSCRIRSCFRQLAHGPIRRVEAYHSNAKFINPYFFVSSPFETSIPAIETLHFTRPILKYSLHSSRIFMGSKQFLYES